jgi:hypothetical protein
MAVTLAGAVLLAGSPGAASLVVDPGSWLLPLLAAIYLGERRSGHRL